MPQKRHSQSFCNGRNQAVRIPREFELPGKEVLIYKKGSCLVIEPIEKQNTLAALLKTWSASNEEFPDIPNIPPEDVDL